MTITQHWWAIPLFMVLAAAALFLYGNNKQGAADGFWETIISLALLFSAGVSLAVGLLK